MENEKIICYVFKCKRDGWYYLIKNFDHEKYKNDEFMESYNKEYKIIELENETFKNIKKGYGFFNSAHSIWERGLSSPFKNENNDICEVKTLTEDDFNKYMDQGKIIVLQQKEEQEQENEIIIENDTTNENILKESEEEKEESEEEKEEVGIDMSGIKEEKQEDESKESKESKSEESKSEESKSEEPVSKESKSEESKSEESKSEEPVSKESISEEPENKGNDEIANGIGKKELIKKVNFEKFSEITIEKPRAKSDLGASNKNTEKEKEEAKEKCEIAITMKEEKKTDSSPSKKCCGCCCNIL